MLQLTRYLPLCLLPALILHAILPVVATANEPAWPVNFEAAQEKAKTQQKFVFAAFIGSDWCPYCKNLKAEVFDKPAFMAAVRKQFVTVEIDFPHEKKQPEAIKEQNRKLAKKYGINTYPSILLLEPDGKLMAHTGYGGGGPDPYFKHLVDLVKTYESLPGLRSQLPAARGLDRAKLLDKLIDAYNKLDNEIAALPGWRKEIVKLDADNSAGLKHKYEFRVYLDDARDALAAGHPVVAEKTIDKALDLKDITPVQMQRGAIVKSNCYVAQKKYQVSLDLLRKALDAAPKSPNADTLKELIGRSEKLLKADK